MKQNLKFFSIIIALLLVSSAILIGSMRVIAADFGNMKTYDMGNQIYDVAGNVIIADDKPIAQAELQKKFGAMYNVSEDGKSITVISEDYLSDFWLSNYEKEVIHSLSTDEVFFIIQDSIRIYQLYDTIVLPAFASVSSVKQVAERFPSVDEQVINTKPTQNNRGYDEDVLNIYDIIMYRLTALSSPKAFFTGEEAILFVGGYPGIYSSMLPWTTFYIPRYSENTDRDYILSVIGQSAKKNVENIDLDKFSDLFGFCNKNGVSISFKSKINKQSSNIFPTEEMYKVSIPDEFETNKDDTPNQQ